MLNSLIKDQKIELEAKLHSQYNLLDMTLKSLEELVEKQNDDTFNKFENVEKSITEAIETVKYDVKEILQ